MHNSEPRPEQAKEASDEHDAWFRAQVSAGLDSASSGRVVPSDEVEARFSAKRQATRERLRQETLEAWEHYRATGLHATEEEADKWLGQLERGNDVEPPRGHT